MNNENNELQKKRQKILKILFSCGIVFGIVFSNIVFIFASGEQYNLSAFAASTVVGLIFGCIFMYVYVVNVQYEVYRIINHNADYGILILFFKPLFFILYMLTGPFYALYWALSWKSKVDWRDE